jgi:hypothetical protein
MQRHLLAVPEGCGLKLPDEDIKDFLQVFLLNYHMPAQFSDSSYNNFNRSQYFSMELNIHTLFE